MVLKNSWRDSSESTRVDSDSVNQPNRDSDSGIRANHVSRVTDSESSDSGPTLDEGQRGEEWLRWFSIRHRMFGSTGVDPPTWVTMMSAVLVLGWRARWAAQGA